MEDGIVRRRRPRRQRRWSCEHHLSALTLMHRHGYKTGIKPLGQSLDVKNAIKNISDDLPPINDIELMFDHLVSRVPGVTKLVEKLAGRKLRLATMCS